MKRVLGTKLSARAREQALARFVHRHTGEHRPAYVGDSPAPFISDADWLAHTHFYVRNDGLLSERHGHCESTPPGPGHHSK